MTVKVKRAITRTLKSSSSCSMPGVWRAVSYCQGLAVVFHSPKACAHIARRMDIGSHFRSQARSSVYNHDPVPLIASMLRDSHAIFGGEQQLRDCLKYTVQQHQPEAIVIANSCVSGVIGDDIQAVAQQAENRYGIPVMPVNCAGFLDGEYFAGYYETAAALIERFMVKQPVIPDTVYLIGDYGGPNGEYAREISRLLKYFNLQVIGQFPTYTKFADLAKVPCALLNIVLGGRRQAEQSVEDLAYLLKDKFATPYYADNYPLGWQSTKLWLQGLGEMLGQDSQATKAITQETIQRDKKLLSLKQGTKNKKVLLCIGRRVNYFQPKWVLELIQLLEFNFLGIVLLNCYVEQDKQDMLEAIRLHTDLPVYAEYQLGELALDSDLVLTTHELNNPELKQLYLPMQPAAGVSGELNLAEKIFRLLHRRNHKGGIVYG